MTALESAPRLFAGAEVRLGRQRSPQHDSGPHMVPYLRAANVKDGFLDLSDVKEMNFDPAEQAIFALQPGDILVTEGSGSLSAVGASSVWNGELPGTICFQNTLVRLRPRPGVTDGRYLAWWSRAAYASGEFAAIASGANIYHLSAERIKGLAAPLPPLDEQRRIADFLDAETSVLDDVHQRRLRQRASLDELAQSHVDTAIQLAGDSPLVRLGYLAGVQTGVTVDANREPGEDTVTLPYLRVANVQAGRVDLSTVTEISVPRATAAASTLRAGDVLMTEGGDLDKLGRGTVWRGEISACLHQNHVFAVRPDSQQLIPDYLALLTRSSMARDYFERTGNRTTNLASTSSSKIRDFRVPLHEPTTQATIVARIEDRLRWISEFETRLDRQLTLLAERSQALITAAVTGQLDVTTAKGITA